MKLRFSPLALAVMLVPLSGLSEDVIQTPPLPTPPNTGVVAATNITPTVQQVVKLAQSGVGDDVIIAYIDNSRYTFNLTPDNIVYLHTAGISSPAIAAMIRHDSGLQAQLGSSPPAPASSETPASAGTSNDADVGSAAAASSFYNSLSPYGTWQNLPGYGWCWQPSVASSNSDWTPYTDNGQWLYSDAGWYWNSNYPWGWAPFHYGRWWCDDSLGWLWFPGSTWAPSWVTWSSWGNFCGWAPLPPGFFFGVGFGLGFHDHDFHHHDGDHHDGDHHDGDHHDGHDIHDGHNGHGGHDEHVSHFANGHDNFGLRSKDFTFVHKGDFGSKNLNSVRVSHSDVNGFFDHTTSVNNFAADSHGRVMNRGMDFNQMAGASHTPITTASIKDMPSSHGSGMVTHTSPNSATVQTFRPDMRPVHPMGGQPSVHAPQPFRPVAPLANANNGSMANSQANVFRPGLMNNPQPTSAESLRINPHLQPVTPNVGNPSGAAIGSRNPVVTSNPNGFQQFNSGMMQPNSMPQQFSAPQRPFSPPQNFAPSHPNMGFAPHNMGGMGSMGGHGGGGGMGGGHGGGGGGGGGGHR